jgi:hypothetical protein
MIRSRLLTKNIIAQSLMRDQLQSQRINTKMTIQGEEEGGSDGKEKRCDAAAREMDRRDDETQAEALQRRVAHPTNSRPLLPVCCFGDPGGHRFAVAPLAPQDWLCFDYQIKNSMAFFHWLELTLRPIPPDR